MFKEQTTEIMIKGWHHVPDFDATLLRLNNLTANPATPDLYIEVTRL